MGLSFDFIWASVNVTTPSSFTVDGIVIISNICVNALGERTSLGLGNIIGRKEDNLSSKMDGLNPIAKIVVEDVNE